MFLYKGKSKHGVEVQAVGNKFSQKFDFLLSLLPDLQKKDLIKQTHDKEEDEETQIVQSEEIEFGMQSSIPP